LESLLSPIIPGSKDEKKGVKVEPLHPKSSGDKDLRHSLREIPIESISSNPYQPRGRWDHQELSELADSIRKSGIVQPVTVRPNGPGYQIIAGERRLRAAKLAAMSTIPALVRPASDQQLLELALVENIHRTDLNPIERAGAYQKYLKEFSLTQAEAAERLGENRSVVANYVRLLDLPEEVRQMLVDGDLSMGHARAILALPGDDLRRKLANRAMTGRLSVREVERLVRRYLSKTSGPQRHGPERPAHILELENRLARYLGTPVSIHTRRNGQRGRITIEFFSLDEFDRIAERMGLEPVAT
jgi:ParB family chromosome partitioning protein